MCLLCFRCKRPKHHCHFSLPQPSPTLITHPHQPRHPSPTTPHPSPTTLPTTLTHHLGHLTYSLLSPALSLHVPRQRDAQTPTQNFRDIFRDELNQEVRHKDCSSFDYEGKVSRTRDEVPCKKWDDAYSPIARSVLIFFSNPS